MSTLQSPPLPRPERSRSSSPRPNTLTIQELLVMDTVQSGGSKYSTAATSRIVEDDGDLTGSSSESSPPEDEAKKSMDPECVPCAGYVETPVDQGVMDLITELGSKDANYTGLLVYSQSAADPKMTVYSPFEDSSPPQLIVQDGTPSPVMIRAGLRWTLCHGLGALGIDVFKDGKPSTSAATTPIWTLRLTDGQLYVFKNGRIVDSPNSPGIPVVVQAQFYHKNEVFAVVSPRPILEDVTDFPVNQRETKLKLQVGRSDEQVKVICRDMYYLALDLQNDPPELVTLVESVLRDKLERLKLSKKTLEEAKFIPFINIAAATEKQGCCNLAFYFTTSIHYHFVHVGQNRKPIIKTVPRDKGENPDISLHLQFSDVYNGGGRDCCDNGGVCLNGASNTCPSQLSSDDSSMASSSQTSHTVDSLQNVQSIDSGFASGNGSVPTSTAPACGVDERECLACSVPFDPHQKSPSKLTVDIVQPRVCNEETACDFDLDVGGEGNGVENGSSPHAKVVAV